MAYDIKIIYEDDNLLAIDKPAGLSVHPDGRGSTEETLVNWINHNYPEMAGVGEPMLAENGERVDRPGIVHRLDKDTSGVLLLAKNEPTYKYLKRQFHDHKIRKTYRSIVSGELTLKGGRVWQEINVPIGRSRKDPRIRVASRKAPGVLREAITFYRVLENYSGFTYIEAYPKTGRTHQLRAHFKCLNNPIACDKLYAPDKPCPVGLNRQALHAYSLTVKLPGGDEAQFVAPLPPDFQKALDNLKAV